MSCCTIGPICWCFMSDCTHVGTCGQELRSGTRTADDSRLLFEVRNARMRQNPCPRTTMSTLPCCVPCCFWAMVISFCCESNSFYAYQDSKLDQSHRFQDCVCCFSVVSFTMIHDPSYKHRERVNMNNPIINIHNENKIGDISNNSSSNPVVNTNVTQSVTDNRKKIKTARMEAAIAEGRYSDAEVIAKEIETMNQIINVWYKSVQLCGGQSKAAIRTLTTVITLLAYTSEALFYRNLVLKRITVILTP